MSDHEKRCTRCGEVKAADAFSPKARGKLGRASRCKQCAVALALERGCRASTDRKVCTACGQSKLKTEFYRHSYGTDGLSARCRGCHEMLPCRSPEARHLERMRAKAG